MSSDLEVRVAQLEVVHKKDIEMLCTKMSLLKDVGDKALLIQTKEFERRLDALNGEAERLRKMQATYVPREPYDLHVRDSDEAIDRLNSFKDNLQGRIAMIAGIVALVISVLTGVGFILLRIVL